MLLFIREREALVDIVSFSVKNFPRRFKVTKCNYGLFPLLPLRFSLSWNFAVLIMICLEVDLFGFLLIGTVCVSWICVTFSLIRLGKFSIVTFSNRFSIPCSSSSPSGIPIIWILLCLFLGI